MMKSRRKVFFSLLELFIVFSLFLLIGSFSIFYLQKTLSLRRFENNHKNLQHLISYCREMAIVHQMDIALFMQQEPSTFRLICEVSYENGKVVPAFFPQKRVSFEPLLLESESLKCVFYSSGFVATPQEKIRISDGKRECFCIVSSQIFPDPAQNQKPIHPFSLRQKEASKKS